MIQDDSPLKFPPPNEEVALDKPSNIYDEISYFRPPSPANLVIHWRIIRFRIRYWQIRHGIWTTTFWLLGNNGSSPAACLVTRSPITQQKNLLIWTHKHTRSNSSSSKVAKKILSDQNPSITNYQVVNPINWHLCLNPNMWPSTHLKPQSALKTNSAPSKKT